MEPNPSGMDPADEPVSQPAQFSSAKRLEAQRQRNQAQELYQKSQAVWEETARSGEAAWRVFEARPAPGEGPVSQHIQAVQEQSESSEASYRRLWDRALAAQEKSTGEFQRAADAVAAANAQVDQELADAADVVVAAQAALSAAMEELRRTQAIWTELGSSLDSEPASRHRSGTVTTREETPNLLRHEPAQGSADAESTEAISATETLRQEIARARKSASPSSAPSPAEEVRQELETLQGLQRELSAISPIVTNPIVTNKETIKIKGQTEEQLLADIVLGSTAPSDEPAPASPDASAIYTGRVYLMFDANLTQAVLETVWDAIEESSEVGAIVDTRLVSQEEGVQMTLDLRASQLDIPAVRARLPGAEFSPLGEDRLRVSWPVPV
jgi:hypothetical protein